MIFVTLFLIATLLLFASYTDGKRLQEQNIPIPTLRHSLGQVRVNK